MSAGVSGDGGPPLDLLPPQAQGRPLGPGGAQGPRAPPAADAQPDRPAPRAADHRLRARAPRLRAAADLRRAGAREVGRPADLRARRLARAGPGRAEHPLQAPGADRPPPRPLRAQARRCRRPSATSTPPEPGEKVQLDCFYVGRLSGTKGTVWQYTAIDVASAYAWAELHTSERNPRARHTRELVHRVAARARRRRLEAGRGHHRQRLGVPRHASSARPSQRARRPPALHPRRPAELQRLRRARPADDPRGVLAPRLRPLARPQDHRAQRDLDEYLNDYNYDRAHTGRLTQGRVPAEIVYGARKTRRLRAALGGVGSRRSGQQPPLPAGHPPTRLPTEARSSRGSRRPAPRGPLAPQAAVAPLPVAARAAACAEGRRERRRAGPASEPKRPCRSARRGSSTVSLPATAWSRSFATARSRSASEARATRLRTARIISSTPRPGSGRAMTSGWPTPRPRAPGPGAPGPGWPTARPAPSAARAGARRARTAPP